MNARSRRLLFLFAISFTALSLLCLLNYWTGAHAIDALIRRELNAGARTTFEMSTAAMTAHDAAISELRRGLLFNIIVAAVVAAAFSFITAQAWQRRARSIERVTEGARAVAAGKLDLDLVTSSDDVRLFAESFNIVSGRLREELEREAESRQFASFIRVSAMLAHDLKNAIQGMSLLVRNMEQFHDREDFRAEAMQALKDETTKLQNLVNRLNQPVESLSGEHKRPQETNLVPLLRSAVKSVIGPSSQHQVELRLPDALSAVVDAERMAKVVENLLLNAIQAIGEQSGTITLIAGSAGSDAIFFSITDTGPGMTADFQSKQLFRPFATTKRGGLGLGLYTCREVIQAHGGTIDVESKPSAGTTFRVVLPCAPMSAGANGRSLTKNS
jgi:signal transduction histidine kinase